MTKDEQPCPNWNSQEPYISSFDVRRHSSGFGRLTSQSCDEGRTTVPKLEYRKFACRRKLQSCVPCVIGSSLDLFGSEETLARFVFVHRSRGQVKDHARTHSAGLKIKQEVFTTTSVFVGFCVSI